MIKIKYNSNTGQILGNYPSSINYSSLTIDKDNKTITDQSGTFPYIEITKEQHEDGMDKNMVVIDGNYQEYVKTSAELLQEAKNKKIAEIKVAKDEVLYLPIDYLDTQFISSEKASQNILGALVLNGDNNHWLDINGNVLVLSRAELEQLGILIKTQRGMVYNNEATKITAINNATTIEEVNNITW